jgi:excisionase family DNA binding protein
MSNRLVSVPLPAELVEAVAERVAEILIEQERSRRASTEWPEWMSVETAARYLDMTPHAARKLYERGTVPFHQDAPGCRVRFRRSDLDAYMAGLLSPRSDLQ